MRLAGCPTAGQGSGSGWEAALDQGHVHFGAQAPLQNAWGYLVVCLPGY